MASGDVFGEVGGQLAENLFSSILWFGIGAIVIGVLGFVMWWFLIYKKKFNIEVKIISERSQDKNNLLFDRAAILVDRKTKTKYFSLWTTKVDLPVPHFNILQRTDKGDYLEIYRTGEDRFYYCLPPKINRTFVAKEGGKPVPISSQKVDVIDPDLAYWSVKRKSLNKSMFDPEKVWMKILPFIPHLLAGVFIIFVLYILMSYLPDILAQLKELSTSLANERRAEVTTVATSWMALI